MKKGDLITEQETTNVDTRPEKVAIINLIAVIIAALIGFAGGIAPYLLQGNSINNKDVIQSQVPGIMSDNETIVGTINDKSIDFLGEEYDVDAITLVYNESTYIPLKETADFISQKFDIYPKSKEGRDIGSAKPAPKVYLEEFVISGQKSRSKLGHEIKEGDSYQIPWDSYTHKDSSGEKHSHGIYVRSWQYIEIEMNYKIDNGYKGIYGTYTVSFDSININVPTELLFYSVEYGAYGKENERAIGGPFLINGGMEPIDFNINLEGVNTLKIKISSNAGERDEFFVGLVDTYFY